MDGGSGYLCRQGGTAVMKQRVGSVSLVVLSLIDCIWWYIHYVHFMHVLLLFKFVV